MDIYAKHFFLTYARTDLDPQDFVDHAIPTFDTDIAVKSYTVAKEAHEDGYPHLHALLSFDRKLHVRDESFFDTTDYTGETRHPNIRSAPRAYAAWLTNTIAYCKKGENFISTHPTSSVDKWKSIYEAAQSEINDHAFMQCVFNEDPRSGFLYGDNILRNRQFVHQPLPVPHLYRRDQFLEPNDLTNWVETNLTVI